MDEAHAYRVADRDLACGHCGHDRFFRRGGDLGGLYNDALFSGAARCVTYACAACGWLIWFAEGAVHDHEDEGIVCLRCSGPMSVDDASCRSCGWTYEQQADDPLSSNEPTSADAEPEAPGPAARVCPHCGGERGTRETICAGCGQIFEAP